MVECPLDCEGGLFRELTDGSPFSFFAGCSIESEWYIN